MCKHKIADFDELLYWKVSEIFYAISKFTVIIELLILWKTGVDRFFIFQADIGYRGGTGQHSIGVVDTTLT